MVHDNLTDAAEHIATLKEEEELHRRLAFRCLQELTEQCPPGCQISTDSLAGMLALIAPSDA